MSRDDAYTTAVEMFKREHDRWIQNALVLFGVLVAVLLADKTSFLPRWLVLLVATLISAMTVFVSLTIRGSTDAWRETVRHIEEQSRAGNDVRPFQIFDEYLRWYTESHGHWRDFVEIVCGWRSATRFRARGNIGRLGCREWKRKVLLSVTRLYTLMAFVATLLFAILLVYHGLAWLTQSHGLSVFARRCDRFDMFN
jgi:hypothetical protein